jgi:rhodanese-related sulfurtransferase
MSTQFPEPSFSRMSVESFAMRLADGMPEGLQLLDVREPQELAIAKLEGFQNLPLSQSAEWSNTIQSRLDPQAETIVMCHHGMRSAQMCQWLVTQGFTSVSNLEGGIHAYSVQVDPSIPQY